jgi:EthD domain
MKVSMMHKRLAFLYKKNETSREALIDYYEHHHVPLILSLLPAPLVYRRRYLARDEALNANGEEEIDFDVVTELGFADRDAYRAWLEHASRAGIGDTVAADEANFLDRSRTRAFEVDEYVTAE